MTTYALGREEILSALQRVFEPLPYVYAMWEGGAVSWGRADQWSDIDLQFDVADEQVDTILPMVEETLQQLSPIELRYVLPNPTWHGNPQAFYRLRDTSPFLLIDLCVMRHSAEDKFLQPEIHGNAVVYFDKANVVQCPPLNLAEFQTNLRKRLETVTVWYEMTQIFTSKELERSNAIEAMSFYLSYTVRPLIEVLRMRYDPFQYNFFTRYLYYNLPRDLVKRLEGFFFVKDVETLRTNHQAAQAWFWEVVQELRSESNP